MAGDTLQQDPPLSFTAGLCLGLYLVTVGYANRWLIFSDEGWRLRRQINWSMVVITNTLLLLILADTALNLHASMARGAFVQSGRSVKQWKDDPWDAIVVCFLTNSIALLADTVLMYRLWVVYNRKFWILYFPIFLWFAGVVCTILQAYLQAVHIHNRNFGPYQWASVNMVTGPGIVLTPFWLSTIILNGFCTGLIIWRVWRASKRSGDNSAAKRLRFLIRVLMESGILLLLIGIAHFFVWFGRDNFAIYVLGILNRFMIAAAFNLILIRVAQNRVEDGEPSTERVSTMAFNPRPPIITVHTHSSVDTTVYGHFDRSRSSNEDTVTYGGNLSKSSV